MAGGDCLRRAVKKALDTKGIEVLETPDVFVNTVRDFSDNPDLSEVAALIDCCDKELLALYIKATGDGRSLSHAAWEAEGYLRTRIKGPFAHEIAWGIARGLADHLGNTEPLPLIVTEEPHCVSFGLDNSKSFEPNEHANKELGREYRHHKYRMAVVLAIAALIVLIIVTSRFSTVTPRLPPSSTSGFGTTTAQSDDIRIVSISAGNRHTVALRGDGTVVATGLNEDGRCDVAGWRDVVAVSAGYYHTVALRGDGTVVATGRIDDGQCDVAGWGR